MRRSCYVLVSAGLFLGTAAPLFAEIFKVVKLTDLRGNPGFRVCAEADMRKIETELKEESKVYQQVVEKVKADWNRTNSEAVFPSNRFGPRTLKVLSTAMDREEAAKLLAKEKLNEERSLVKNGREEAGILKARAGGWGRAHRAAVEEQKSQVRYDQRKDELADRAERLLRQQLSAAVGHAVPYYGPQPEEPKKAPRNKKK